MTMGTYSIGHGINRVSIAATRHGLTIEAAESGSFGWFGYVEEGQKLGVLGRDCVDGLVPQDPQTDETAGFVEIHETFNN